jgi:hypothetical protein
MIAVRRIQGQATPNAEEGLSVMTIAANSGFAREGASSPTGDPWLLTPGPLTTLPAVMAAVLHDPGLPDRLFMAAIGATLTAAISLSVARMAAAAE